MTRPLEGVLVVSLEQAVAAPYCSSRLADSGARVIKVERAEGDFARGYDSAVHGESAYFVWLNRGKESLVLDIKHADDAALLRQIIAKADVFIQNLAPGAAARAGLDSEELRRAHKRLITVDISGYGEDGPYADMKAYDLLVQAEATVNAFDPSANARAKAITNSHVAYASGPYECVQDADALIIATEWDVFKRPDWELLRTQMRGRTIFDGRNVYAPAQVTSEGFEYHGVGRSAQFSTARTPEPANT